MKKGFFKKGAFRRGIVAALTAAMLSTEVFGVSGLAGVLTAYAAEAAAADASANDASENDASENSTSENSATEDVVVVPEGFNSNIAKISVSYDSLALVAGQKVKVDAVYTPASSKVKVDDSFVVWTTSDTKVVNVDNSGNIAATGKGDATISITTLDKPSVKTEIAVHVGDDDELYVVSSMNLQVKEQKKIEVTLGGKVVYGAKFTLVDGKKFAGVNKKSGVVTAKKEGTAKVKVEYKGESKEVTINVKDTVIDASCNNATVKMISAPATVKLTVGKKPTKNVKVKGKGALKGGTVEASVNDARIASVSSVDSKGKCTITALDTGVTYIVWTVKKGDAYAQKVTKVVVTKTAVNSDIKFTASDASGNLVVKDASSNSLVDASLNNATDASGNVIDASINHTLALNATYDIKVGQGVKLNALLAAGITDNKLIKWKSSNAAVKITKQGYLLAVKTSKNPVVISARLGKATATFTVNVVAANDNFSFKKAGATVKAGKKTTLQTTKGSTIAAAGASVAGINPAIGTGKKANKLTVNVAAGVKSGTYFVWAVDTKGNRTEAEIFVP